MGDRTQSVLSHFVFLLSFHVSNTNTFICRTTFFWFVCCNVIILGNKKRRNQDKEMRIKLKQRKYKNPVQFQRLMIKRKVSFLSSIVSKYTIVRYLSFVLIFSVSQTNEKRIYFLYKQFIKFYYSRI